MSVIALIPARSGSKGIPSKNFRTLGGKPLYAHAIECAIAAGVERIIVSTDHIEYGCGIAREVYTKPEGGTHYSEVRTAWTLDYLPRPAELAQDDTPMLSVVQHAMHAEGGAQDDIWLILQPTQPLRTPEQVKAAITLLQESGADSVVSVVPLPLTHAAPFQCWVRPTGRLDTVLGLRSWDGLPNRRQAVPPHYIRDGTCYAFRRATVDQHGTIYGQDVRPLIIDPADSCELDTESDWLEVERRWKERHG